MYLLNNKKLFALAVATAMTSSFASIASAGGEDYTYVEAVESAQLPSAVYEFQGQEFEVVNTQTTSVEVAHAAPQVVHVEAPQPVSTQTEYKVVVEPRMVETKEVVRAHTATMPRIKDQEVIVHSIPQPPARFQEVIMHSIPQEPRRVEDMVVKYVDQPNMEYDEVIVKHIPQPDLEYHEVIIYRVPQAPKEIREVVRHSVPQEPRRIEEKVVRYVEQAPVEYREVVTYEKPVAPVEYREVVTRHIEGYEEAVERSKSSLSVNCDIPNGNVASTVSTGTFEVPGNWEYIGTNLPK